MDGARFRTRGRRPGAGAEGPRSRDLRSGPGLRARHVRRLPRVRGPETRGARPRNEPWRSARPRRRSTDRCDPGSTHTASAPAGGVSSIRPPTWPSGPITRSSSKDRGNPDSSGAPNEMHRCPRLERISRFFPDRSDQPTIPSHSPNSTLAMVTSRRRNGIPWAVLVKRTNFSAHRGIVSPPRAQTPRDSRVRDRSSWLPLP
jgi:hypothetical protein